MTIPFWSFSSAQNFDKCPKMLEHRYILKTPKDERDNSAAERGTALHKELELFLAPHAAGHTILDPNSNTKSIVTYTPPIDPPQFRYEGLVGEIKDLCTQHPFTQEEMLYFNRDWSIVPDFKDAWLLMAMDVFIRVSGDECIIVDWKSGKKEGNEIKHQSQGQLYALGAWKRYPELKKFTVKFVYLDQNTQTTAVWKRGHLERIYPMWNDKGRLITGCEVFLPKPNKWNCRYCDYQSRCEFAIRESDI